MGDLLGSGRLPYRADTVMLLHYRKMIPLGKAKPGSETRAYKPRHPQELTLLIAKTRDGGHRGTVDLWWDEHFSKLLTVSTITQQERARIDRSSAKEALVDDDDDHEITELPI
jgi:replicative DNA helicase